MTIDLIEDADTKLLEVTASGKLSKDDYELFEPAVSVLIEKAGKINVLFVMQDFHGWEMGAVWEDIKFATKHCRDINRIAMVGEAAWEQWMASICKPFTMSTVKYFKADELDSARDWLSSAE